MLDIIATHERGIKKPEPEAYKINQDYASAIRTIAAMRAQWPHLTFALKPTIDPVYARDCG